MVLPQQMHVASIRNSRYVIVAQNHLQNPQGAGQDYKESARATSVEAYYVHVTFDLSEIENTLPRRLNSKEATCRARDKLL